MNVWSARNLTPYGRNTVLKSLLLPKLNHLFSSLPNPPKAVIERLQKKCFNFIWQNKPDKIKRNVMMLNPEHGGIKTPNIRKIISSQKLKWLKRINDKDNKWACLFINQLKMKSLFLLTDCHSIPNLLPSSYNNPFWRDILLEWSDFISVCKNNWNNEEEILSQCIWNNNNIRINREPIYYNEWYRKGVVFVNDLLHEQGRLYTHEEFSKTFSIKTNFLNYESVKRAILAYAKEMNIKQFKNKLTLPFLPYNIDKILNVIGSQHLYASLLDSNFVNLPCYRKWEQVLQENFIENDWKIFNRIANKCTQCTDLRWLQYRVIHNILPTRKFLCKIGYTTSPLCPFCEKSD